jgi:hypothetical protein
MNLNGNFVFLLNSLKCDLNFFKRKSGASWEEAGEMYPLFQDLIEHQRENLLKLLVFKLEYLISEKLTTMQNFEQKAMFLKMKKWRLVGKNPEKCTSTVKLCG